MVNCLFSRKARETMLSVLIDLGQEIPSKVLKDCNSYGEAEKYKKEFEQSDNDINKILKFFFVFFCFPITITILQHF